MERYQKFATILKEENGVRRYSTLRMPRIPYKDSDIYIVSKASDRLDLLAYEYYNDPRLWVIIARANRLFAGSIRVPPGIQVRIPYPLSRSDIHDIFNDVGL